MQGIYMYTILNIESLQVPGLNPGLQPHLRVDTVSDLNNSHNLLGILHYGTPSLPYVDVDDDKD
jgi:hypothetical protein